MMVIMVRISILNKIICFLSLAIFIWPGLLFADDIIVNSNVSITAQVLSSNSNGGGDSTSGSLINLPTNINFSGIAYPLSSVYILKDGFVVMTTISDLNGNFSASISGLVSDVYTFSIYAVDSHNRKSSFFSFPIYLARGVNVNIGNIFLSPTIDVDKTRVKKGNSLAIFGQSLPLKEVVVSVFSGQEYIYRIFSNELGLYFYNLDTSILSIGDYQTKSKTILNTQESLYSTPVLFSVEDNDILKNNIDCSTIRGDLNCDGHVNLTDFSILAFWYKKVNPPVNVDLNNDRAVNLVDFSIMAYNWTG